MIKQRTFWYLGTVFLMINIAIFVVTTYESQWVFSTNRSIMRVFDGWGGEPFGSLWYGLAHLGHFSFCLILSCAIGIVLGLFKRGLTGMLLVGGLIACRFSRNLILDVVARSQSSAIHGLLGTGILPSEEMVLLVFFFGFLIMLLIYLLMVQRHFQFVSWCVLGSVIFTLLEIVAFLSASDLEPFSLVTGGLLGGCILCYTAGLLERMRRKGLH